MTLPDLEEQEEENVNPHQYGVKDAVVEVVKQAAEEGRVTCDISSCVQLLGSTPEEVMLCLIATLTGTQDVTVKIQHVLIRAFCQENTINLLHVHDNVKLTQLLMSGFSQSGTGKLGDVIKAPLEENSVGYSCVLIKYPKHETSHEDDLVADYIKDELKIHAEPFVTLPD